ncbi:hypothetical protein LAZ67_23000348, partial [Cordylochernes scorpioides]
METSKTLLWTRQQQQQPNDNKIISDMWIEELSYSDHLPIVLQINTGHEAIKSSYNNEILTRKFIWTKENVEMLKHNLSDIEVGNETNINTETVNFTKQIYTAMESANIIKFAKRRHQLSKPWYDKDCYIMKKTTKVSLQRCRNSNNIQDRQKYIEARREYFKLLQRKRDEFNKDKNERIKNAKDPKSFWNAIASFRKKPIIQGEIDIKEWFLFYKNLLNKENKEATFTLNQMIGWKDPDLDAEITLEEIHDVVKKLANGKAVGLDGIPNELLKNLPIPTLTKLKNLFNKIMSTEKYPQLWTNSIVHPIYKSGDKNNPTNYRGIALCSNISKLFTTILRNRLNNWIEKREIILENQAGFRKNRSCTDHIILLNSLIQLSLRRKRGKLYVFFVDLTKAFDTVPHDLLWQKLHKMGISNKFVMLIKNFYQEAKITIRWKGQYSSNSYQISSKIKFEIKDKKVEKKARKIIHDCKNVTSTYNIFHEKINMKELDYALENTDLNKTPGPDGIHGQMISNLGKNGKEKLLDIFNNSWKTGKLPQDWKTATIIPIKKLDKSADDPKNYRPISLTSICCKLMEKIILRRLTYHLDTRNLLPEEQYGFRKGHGTIDQLLFFTQKVKDAQNRKPTNHTIAAFLDLTQAFDKVWKNKLITKLYKHFKIDGKAITWINDFLKNRYIRVKYNGTLSKTFKLYQGLPQGSVLSPTLFTLFIAGIEEKISHKTNIGLFADDIILWSSNTNWKKAERDLNKTLFHLEKFANKHKLEFNPQKSETCLFTTDKKLYKIRPKIILKEQQLQYNKHPKYLGYTLDPEINSSKHIEEVIRKGRDRLKILKYISGREWGADATTLKLTYTSLIRPILEYGYQIYGTASETNLKSLERIQLSAARIIT